jgi:hypothetical protein
MASLPSSHSGGLLVEAAVDGGAVDAEFAGGGGDVAVFGGDGFTEGLVLDVFEIGRADVGGFRGRETGGSLRGSNEVGVEEAGAGDAMELLRAKLGALVEDLTPDGAVDGGG